MPENEKKLGKLVDELSGANIAEKTTVATNGNTTTTTTSNGQGSKWESTTTPGQEPETEYEIFPTGKAKDAQYAAATNPDGTKMYPGEKFNNKFVGAKVKEEGANEKTTFISGNDVEKEREQGNEGRNLTTRDLYMTAHENGIYELDENGEQVYGDNSLRTFRNNDGSVSNVLKFIDDDGTVRTYKREAPKGYKSSGTGAIKYYDEKGNEIDQYEYSRGYKKMIAAQKSAKGGPGYIDYNGHKYIYGTDLNERLYGSNQPADPYEIENPYDRRRAINQRNLNRQQADMRDVLEARRRRNSIV